MKHLKTYESTISIPWKIVDSNENIKVYQFNIDQYTYQVKFTKENESSVYLLFYILPKDDSISVDYGRNKKTNPYKLMSIISNVTKDYIQNNPDIDKIRFFGMKDSKKSMPVWIFDLITSQPFIYYISSYLDSILVRQKNWISKPSQRTKMFNRWVNKEIANINWKSKRIGNELILLRDKKNAK